MPEYLAPGVYIEETSFRSKSIEGVGTTTTGFVGPTGFGPIDLPLEVITSLGQFVQVFGDGSQLRFHDQAGGSDVTLHNYMWHAVRAFFQEGGSKLYVSRIFRNRDGTTYLTPDDDTVPVDTGGGLWNDGTARAPDSYPSILHLRARYPGAQGNLRVRVRVQVGANALSWDAAKNARVAGILPYDVVLIGSESGSPPGGVVDGSSPDYYSVSWDVNEQDWHFTPKVGGVKKLKTDFAFGSGLEIRPLSLAVSITPAAGGASLDFNGIALDPRHQQNGAGDSLYANFGRFAETPARNADMPVVVPDPTTADGLDLLNAFDSVGSGQGVSLKSNLHKLSAVPGERTVEILLSGGSDGGVVQPSDYEGFADPSSAVKTGLKHFEDIDEIAIVAAPGSTYGYETSPSKQLAADTVIGNVLDHCYKMRYRIAVIDAGNGQTVGQVQKQRGRFDSSWGALYYPWVKVLDPITRVPIYLPPSGFVSGIFARNDVTRAVYKAPANEVVNLALGFETLLNKAQQDILNPLGVNCFRFFEGRGNRLWGARTMSSDPEWKYVNLRRYFAYLEHSIDRGTQWAVFEPNSELLWANVRRTISDFLFAEWQAGAFLGDKPEKAFFVRCDRSTMNQNDLDNGRLVCLIGVAVVKPAEYVIFRIGQWTADAQK